MLTTNTKLLSAAVAVVRSATMQGPAGTTARLIAERHIEDLRAALAEEGIQWDANPREVEKAIKDREQTEQDRAIINFAREQFGGEGNNGDLDFDDDKHTVVSHGDDNGAYVSCWVWTDFRGTAFDKEDQPGQA